MACLGSVHSLHMQGAIAGAALQHSSTACRAARPATLQIYAGQALLGKVVSSKNPRTIIVAFDSFSEHKIYRKRVRKTSRIVAHDEAQEAKAGDYVQIVPCVPISKTKRHKLDTIVKKFEYYVDESTGEVAALGNYEEDDSVASRDVSASQEGEELGIPAEQLS